MEIKDTIILLDDDGIICVKECGSFLLFVKDGKELRLRVNNVEYLLYSCPVYNRVIKVRDEVLNKILKRSDFIDIKAFI